MQFQIVQHGSKVYQQTVELRYKVLRKPLGLDFTHEQLKAERSDYHCALFDNDKIVACLVLSPVDNSTIQMRQVAVGEFYQKKGLGSSLIKYSESYCRELGFNMIYAHARDIAIPFYEKNNYSGEGPMFEEIGIQHRKMVKPL